MNKLSLHKPSEMRVENSPVKNQDAIKLCCSQYNLTFGLTSTFNFLAEVLKVFTFGVINSIPGLSLHKGENCQKQTANYNNPKISAWFLFINTVFAMIRCFTSLA